MLFTCWPGDVVLDVFLANLVICTAVSVYIAVYPFPWLANLLMVSIYISVSCIFAWISLKVPDTITICIVLFM